MAMWTIRIKSLNLSRIRQRDIRAAAHGEIHKGCGRTQKGSNQQPAGTEDLTI